MVRAVRGKEGITIEGRLPVALAAGHQDGRVRLIAQPVEGRLGFKVAQSRSRLCGLAGRPRRRPTIPGPLAPADASTTVARPQRAPAASPPLGSRFQAD